MPTKARPDTSCADALRERGATVRLLWELKGPKGTSIAWLSGYLVNGFVMIVETFNDGGWMQFTSDRRNDTEHSIADALQRCAKIID